MGIGTIIGGIEAAIGVVTLNPTLIVDGGRRALTSYVVGQALEPVKEVVGEWVGETCDPDIVDCIPGL